MGTPTKYAYLWVVQGCYGGYGWEDLSESEDRAEERRNLREYRLACPEYPHRIIQRRELRDVVTP